MKWLSDDKYQQLAKAAMNWDTLLNSVYGETPEINKEEVTAVRLMADLEAGQDPTQSSELEEAQKTISTQGEEIVRMKAEIDELKGVPSGTKGEATVESEITAEDSSILEYAQKNQGNTLAIMHEANKTGFFKH